MAGYVDIHSHGGGGFTFGLSVEESVGAARAQHAHGTDAIIGSLVTSPTLTLEQQLGIMREAMAVEPLIVGAHLEDPFLAPSRKGAHAPELLETPSPARVDDLIAAGEGVLRQITIAPELPGALDAIATFRAAGIVPAVGHTAADAAIAAEAFAAGAGLLTHGFNAMAPIQGRDPGPLGAAIAHPTVVIEVIADGIHVDPRNIAMLFAAAPGRIALMTDAMAAAGHPDGMYRLGALDVEVTNGRAVVAGTDTLAGSTLTLDRAVQVCLEAGIDADAVQAAVTTTPARLFGIPL